MNPYASHLEGRDAFAVIAETPQALADLVRPLDDRAIGAAPAPGKWSIREILAHLADCEVVFAFRLRQTVAQENHTMQPFDQDAWARQYGAYSAQESLATFTTVRKWNIRFLDALPKETFAKQTTHPERGTMTLRTIVETMGGHDRNHVKQVMAAATATRT